MSQADDARTSGPIADLVRDTLLTADDHGRALLRRGWLSGLTRELRRARRAAGFSQEAVAARLGTTQSVIARLEHDRDGSFTVRRLVDYALAVDYFPYELELAPFDDVHTYAVANPDAPRDALHVWTYHLWRSLGTDGPGSVDPESLPCPPEQPQLPAARDEPDARPPAAAGGNIAALDDECPPGYSLAA